MVQGGILGVKSIFQQPPSHAPGTPDQQIEGILIDIRELLRIVLFLKLLKEVS